MLPWRGTCSASLLNVSSCQNSHHRGVATKLAPKWTPLQHSGPATPSRTNVPAAPNLGKWATSTSPPSSSLESSGIPNKYSRVGPGIDAAVSSPRPFPSAPCNQLQPKTQRVPSSTPMDKWARQRPTTAPTTHWPGSSMSQNTRRLGQTLPTRFNDIHDRTVGHADPRIVGESSQSWDRWPRPIARAIRHQEERPQQRQQQRIQAGRSSSTYGNNTALLHDVTKSTLEQASNPSIYRTQYNIDSNESDDSRSAGRGNRKLKFKTRGSLRSGGEIERFSRVSNTRDQKQKGFKQPRTIRLIQDVYIPSVVSVTQLARLLGVRLDSLKRKMIQAGMSEATSYDHVLNSEYSSMLALEFNKNPIVNDEAAFDLFPPPAHPDPSTLPLRPPIVTIMGHVDHGKTTLLDTLRSASVAKGEAGGITQHIGAFSVPVPESSGTSARTITFLDTPGHAAFSAMRARGASITDIIVLVVAADDGVMPQTKEVIELVKKDEGKVSVVVAINKMDKPGVDPEAIQNALLAEGLQLETFGGDIPSVEVSGLTGYGLDQLVETISAMAEMADLRAEQEGNVFGYVLESRVLKGLGPVATILITRGSLTPTTNLISGIVYGRVRQLSDSTGKVVKVAYPGMAVTVSGWKELPDAGEEVLQGTEADIKRAIANRKRRLQLAAVVQDAEAINMQRRQERERKEDEKGVANSSLEGNAEVPQVLAPNSKGPMELRLIIKGDVSGSVEAVVGALQGIGNKDVVVKIVQSAVGDVTESDVLMAKTVEGAVVTFSVGVPRSIQTLAAGHDVPIITSSIIYRLMDEIKERAIALLPPIIEKRVTGEATVAQLFEISLKRKEVLKVAGCRVTNGLLEKIKKIRVMRDGEVINEGSLSTLRHLKKDMNEIRKDMECGLSVHGFEDLRVGDIIQSIQTVEKPGVL